MSVVAVTVATRGPPSSRAISPKNPPGPIVVTSSPPIVTAASPSMTTKHSLPDLPSWHSTFPAGASISVVIPASARSSDCEQPLNRLTAASFSTRASCFFNMGAPLLDRAARYVIATRRGGARGHPLPPVRRRRVAWPRRGRTGRTAGRRWRTGRRRPGPAPSRTCPSQPGELLVARGRAATTMSSRSSSGAARGPPRARSWPASTRVGPGADDRRDRRPRRLPAARRRSAPSRRSMVRQLDGERSPALAGVRTSERLTRARRRRPLAHRPPPRRRPGRRAAGRIDCRSPPRSSSRGELGAPRAGEVLFERGRPVRRRLPRRQRPARRRSQAATPIGEIARGEVVGEIGLIERAPRSATVTALRDSTLARFERRRLPRRSTAAHPTLMLQLSRTIARPRRPAARPHRPGPLDRRRGHRPGRRTARAGHTARPTSSPATARAATCGRRGVDAALGRAGPRRVGAAGRPAGAAEYLHEAETTPRLPRARGRRRRHPVDPAGARAGRPRSSSSCRPSPTPSERARAPSACSAPCRRADQRRALAGAGPPGRTPNGRTAAPRSPTASASTAWPTCAHGSVGRPRPARPPRVRERHRPRARRRRRPRASPTSASGGRCASSASRSTPSAGRRSARRSARGMAMRIAPDELVRARRRAVPRPARLHRAGRVADQGRAHLPQHHAGRPAASTSATCGCRSSACRRTSPGHGSRSTTAATLATAIRASVAIPGHPPARAVRRRPARRRRRAQQPARAT